MPCLQLQFIVSAVYYKPMLLGQSDSSSCFTYPCPILILRHRYGTQTLHFKRKIEYLYVFDTWTRVSIRHQYPSSSNIATNNKHHKASSALESHSSVFRCTEIEISKQQKVEEHTVTFARDSIAAEPISTICTRGDMLEYT